MSKTRAVFALLGVFLTATALAVTGDAIFDSGLGKASLRAAYVTDAITVIFWLVWVLWGEE